MTQLTSHPDTEVRVEKRKWPDRVVTHWRATPVGEDAFGHWFLSREDDVHMLPSNADGWIVPGDSIQLLPRDEWWVAWWWGHDGWISVDIATPPTFDGGTWSYVDLELDVVGNEHGEVTLYDEDEFDDLCARGLPHERSVRARAAADDVMHRLAERAEPFGSIGWDVLQRGRSTAR